MIARRCALGASAAAVAAGFGIDASSPAPVAVHSSSTPSTTAAFTPPADSIMVAFGESENDGGGTFSDSLGGTWTTVVAATRDFDCGVTVATRDVGPTPAAMTVSWAPERAVTSTGLKVYVITGAGSSAAAAIGASAIGSAVTSWSRSLTPAASGSLLFFGATNSQRPTLAPNADTTSDMNTSPNWGFFTAAHASALSSAGVPVTLGYTTGMSLSFVQAVAVEVKAA